jgi:2-(1,2-epoxy-1,2-dihydrophenyl)acetyl-CoA isomerase
MALLGERMLAEEALANGLVTRVVEDGGLLQVSHGLATKLAAMPTVALGLIRKQVSVALSGTLAETMEIEADHQSIAAKTEDCREAIAAFLEKREAHFTGR